MYSRILVPTDGSAFSDTVCAHGVAIAEAMGSFVSFLFVMDTLMAYRDGMTSTADAREALTAQGRTTLDRALSVAMAARVRAAGELIEGSPVDVILRRAEDFELVVMGSHRKSFVKRLMMGSVSHAVFMRTTRPTLVVRCGHEAATVVHHDGARGAAAMRDTSPATSGLPALRR